MGRKRSTAKAKAQKFRQIQNPQTPAMSEPETEVAAVGEATSEPETTTFETETNVKKSTEAVLSASSTELEEDEAQLEQSDDKKWEGVGNEQDSEIPSEPVEHETEAKEESTEKESHGMGVTEEAGKEQGTKVMTNEEKTKDDGEVVEESPTIDEAPVQVGEVEAKVDDENEESVKEEETMTKETRDKDKDTSTEVETSTKRKRNSLVEPVKTVDEEGNSLGRPAEEEAEEKYDDPWVTPDSNLRDPKRRICIVTTAALPWRTGTAVNPLLRALYLTRGRPQHYVTLVIPWCDDEEDRQKTLGKEYSFAKQEEQEAWIRDFCRTRSGCSEEEKNLKILFYPAKYHEGFGSIFPSVDICALIPEEEADCAILEEPEHLTWLRVPKVYKETEEEKENNKKELAINNHTSAIKRFATAKEKAELGWRFKFRHVVGIVHTNYKAYAEQYGMGTKFITAPALCALNALVIRAYCHRVILLSGTLPSLTPYKEVTCNVHGVRGEFLERPASSAETKAGEMHARVYFIGKLIWAKGFDKILDLENIYREKHNDYFPIDVYGAGGDEKPIKRAFFGRIPQIQRNDSPKSSEGDSEEVAESPKADATAEVFTWESSLRSHLVHAVPFKESERHDSIDEFEENVARRRSSVDKSAINVFEGKALSGRHLDTSDEEEKPKRRHTMLESIAEKIVPISVIGHTMAKGLDTAKATTGAAVAVARNVVNAGLNVAFTNGMGAPQTGSDGHADKSNGKARKQRLIFDPPQSVFEFRRNPIPARFLGTKDHVVLRDIPDHKIFLNMSITEVLCTTSAEALAMGKWVIVPAHPSNTFFLQFPNCLAYDNLEDCLEKLEWALTHDPTPLSEDVGQKLSWEGANERLFDSSAVSKDEYMEWEETGKIKSDDDAARFHVETGMKGQLIGKFFAREKQSDDK